MESNQYSDPFREVVDEIQEFWEGESDAFGRVFRAAFNTPEYTHYEDISDKADCSKNTAKKHLDRLVEIGCIERNESLYSAVYRRNHAYIEWRVLRHIAENYTMEEIVARVEALEGRREDLLDSTGVVPRVVQADDAKSSEPVGGKMKAANELESVRRRIRLYELARQTIQNDGHLLSKPLN